VFFLLFCRVLGIGVGVVIIVGRIFVGFGIWGGDAGGKVVFIMVGTFEHALVQAVTFILQQFQF
jgi:hypothetical protein